MGVMVILVMVMLVMVVLVKVMLIIMAVIMVVMMLVQAAAPSPQEEGEALGRHLAPLTRCTS